VVLASTSTEKVAQDLIQTTQPLFRPNPTYLCLLDSLNQVWLKTCALKQLSETLMVVLE